MKTLTPALSVASLLFAFPVAAQAVQIGGGSDRRARRGERTYYVEGEAATVVDGDGRVVGRIVAEGDRYALVGGAAVARHATWVLGEGALDIQPTRSPLVLSRPESDRASRRA